VSVTHLMHLVAWFLFISGAYICGDRQVQAVIFLLIHLLTDSKTGPPAVDIVKCRCCVNSKQTMGFESRR